MILYLIIWLVIVAAVTAGIKAACTDGDRAIMVIGWWLFVAGVVTGLFSLWGAESENFDSAPEELIFWACMMAQILTGTVMFPVGACKIADRTKKELAQLRGALSAVKEPPREVFREDKIPAWKRVRMEEG